MKTAMVTSPSLRTKRTTLLGWLLILGGGTLIPISFISLLMIIAGSYGTARVEPLGALLILGGPPMTFVTGIGLLRRRCWARFCLLGILVAVIGHQAYQLTLSPAPETTTISPTGVRTTISASKPKASLPFIGASVLSIVVLLSPAVRAEFARKPDREADR